MMTTFRHSPNPEGVASGVSIECGRIARGRIARCNRLHTIVGGVYGRRDRAVNRMRGVEDVNDGDRMIVKARKLAIAWAQGKRQVIQAYNRGTGGQEGVNDGRK
jgi:hypothetical protein